jgi:hypothetical protein
MSWGAAHRRDVQESLCGRLTVLATIGAMSYPLEQLTRVAITTPHPDPKLAMWVATEADLAPLAALAAGGFTGSQGTPAEVPAEQSWAHRSLDEDFESVFVATHRMMLESVGRPGWQVPLVVAAVDAPETPIGVQYLADDTLSGTVLTSAWLGVEHHGNGYERLMRGIALDLAVTCIGAETVRSFVFRNNAAALELGSYFEYSAPGTQAVRTVGGRLREFEVLEVSAHAYRMRSPSTTSSMSIAGRDALAAALPAPGSIDLRSSVSLALD